MRSLKVSYAYAPENRPGRWALIALLILIGAEWVGAKAPEWTHFTANDGLGAGVVSAILQSADGAMWFTTVGGGVSRYEDTKWKTFTEHNPDGLAGEFVTVVLQSADGAMWFGTDGSGVSRYDGTTWQTFTASDGLTGNTVMSICQASDGVIWFGCSPGISLFQNGNWLPFPNLQDDTITSVFQSADGAMWIGTANSGVSRYDGATWQTFTVADGLAGNMVMAISQTPDGGMWLGPAGGGASRYDGTAWQTFTAADGLAGNVVKVFFQSADGRMWLGTTAGVCRYDGTSWQTFTTSDGLAGSFVNAISQSADGAMWFGASGGVSRYDGQTWQTFTSEDGLASNTVTSAFRSIQGAMWFGTSGGANRYDDAGWQVFRKAENLSCDAVSSVFQSADGALWFGTDNGVCRYDGAAWRTFTTADGLCDNVVSSVFQSADGALWFGTDNGVSRYDGAAWRTFTTADGLAGNQVRAVTQSSDGTLWFGTAGGGASQYTGSAWQIVTTLDGLASNAVSAVFQSADDALWFGTDNGVSRYDGATWRTFTTADGLCDDAVSSVYQSADDALWFGTDNGASRYDGISWESYAQVDGLNGSAVKCVFQDQNGAMWLGTDQGVSVFLRVAQPLVETVIVRHPPSALGINRFFFECQGIEAGSDARSLLSFALISGTEKPEATDWSPFSVVSGFEATNLTNGVWTFYARAQDRYGNVDASPASSTFTVDLTAPTAVISSPHRGDAVSGDVNITGSAFDASAVPDLIDFAIEYGPGETAGEVVSWTRIGDLQAVPVESGLLATWHTGDLPDGAYVLRISATDKLGHNSQHAVAVIVVSALAQLEREAGGYAASADGKVQLMVPPNGLAESGRVRIVSRLEGTLPSPPPGVRGTGIAYEVGPETLTFSKPGTLTIRYEAPGLEEQNLAVFRLSGNGWERLGGTVELATGRISVRVWPPGTYGLFEAPSAGGHVGISEVVCQPRIISPAGGIYPSVTDISFRLTALANVNIAVFSASGNLIRSIEDNRMLNAGLNTVQWDGRDRSGRPVASGPYLVVVRADGTATSKAVMVLNR